MPPIHVGEVTSDVTVESRGGAGETQAAPPPAPPDAPQALRWRLARLAVARDEARLLARDQDD